MPPPYKDAGAFATHSTFDLSTKPPPPPPTRTKPAGAATSSTKPRKTKTRTHADRRYDALRNLGEKDVDAAEEEHGPGDDSSDSGSTTEVEDIEGDAGRDAQSKRWRRRMGRGKAGVWARVKRWRWVVDTGLLLVVVGLLVERRGRDGNGGSGSGKGVLQVGGDVTGFAPSFSQQIVSFAPNDTFAPEAPLDWWSNKTQQAWLDIVPKGLGYVVVPPNSSHPNLPTPIHDFPTKSVYTTSMTHQLHCLYTILEAYNTLQLSAAITPLSTSSSSFTDSERAVKMPWHVTHCFEYLRQSVMCSADVALEGAATTFPRGKGGKDLGGSDGWDAKHVCRAYGEVVGYLEGNAVGGNKWIKSEDVEVEEEEGK